MKNKFLTLGMAMLLFASCAKKIDGTSDETVKASIEAIKKSLNEEEKKEFEEGLTLLVLHGIDFGKIVRGEADKEDVTDFNSKIDGKTASDIIAEGKRIKEEIEKKKKEQAKLEIVELYQKKAGIEEDRVKLASFEVKRSRFYKRKSGTYYITEEPIIELTVRNGTDKAISRAYFTGTLSSPNRTIPWLKDDFNYSISGGLEPGEEATWFLSPNMFSEWGTVKAPSDAVLTVEVKQLDDANGEELYSINAFGDKESERLNELLKKYPEFKR
jgi:hypothetical protein